MIEMNANKEEMQMEFEMFRDIWGMYKTYYHPMDSDEYWEALINSQDFICKKYANSQLCRAVCLAIVNDIKQRDNGNSKIECEAAEPIG